MASDRRKRLKRRAKRAKRIAASLKIPSNPLKLPTRRRIQSALATVRRDVTRSRKRASAEVQLPPHIAEKRRPPKVVKRLSQLEPLNRIIPRGQTCKERPQGGNGSGQSRAFVPWCDRGRR